MARVAKLLHFYIRKSTKFIGQCSCFNAKGEKGKHDLDSHSQIPPPNSPSRNEAEALALLLDDRRRRSTTTPQPFLPSGTLMLTAAATWLRAQPRSIRCVLLILCSPLLIPFLCATFPVLCAAEACFRLCCKKRRKQEEKDEDSCRLRRCEEGRCKEEEDREEGEEGSLLQRYLEDQLRLAGSVYECGDDDYSDDARPLLS